ncbi:FtsQ-type POTRA domain-containing protein [Bdellovibrio bacteriovorus]|uniref:cell division protein FtsQ/DivIB n=1 Tax=Bdellovibrio bacteriovorus TaxID=959 RepID=UPI0021CE7557|nr:cell division protein FtsQ/DivIB [Bdellovibrio bacteriovorus]UXR64438.1 FtsQ-type POTRA domain-containing protein [Bdellovibrio bacteriovorus]
MKKLVLKLIFGFIILPLSLAGTLFYLNKNGFFDIGKVEVILENPPPGQEQFLRPHVDRLEASLDKYKGMSLWNIKLKAVSRDVKMMNWVESLNIKRSWPTTLSVRVRPYEVKLLYMGKGGKLVPIIKGGELLDPVEGKQAPDVVLLEGESFMKKAELRKKAVDVVEQIPAEGSFSRKTISEIRYDNKEGFWMTMIKTGIQVKMGEDQVSLKSARVSQVVDYLESRQFDARVIDANLSKKVLVRLRKGP